MLPHTNITRTLFARFILTTALISYAPGVTTAQELTDPKDAFTLTQEIDGSELEGARRQALQSLIFEPLSANQRAKAEKIACAPLLPPTPVQSSQEAKAALDIVETTLAPEILFGKGAPGNEPESPDFSVALKFEQEFVFVQLSLPRFPSEAGGLQVRYPQSPTRTIWIEGKGASDMLVVVPAVRGCAVKSVVLCPQTYISQGTLTPSEYTPIGIRYTYTTRIDGLYATGTESTGTLHGAISTTRGIPLPKVSHVEDSGKKTPSVSLKYNSTSERRPMSFIPVQLPILGGIEASLAFGNHERVIQRSFTRSHLEVREQQMLHGLTTTIEGAQLQAQPGMCYLVTQWQSSSKG